jgi:hypothetical protein
VVPLPLPRNGSVDGANGHGVEPGITPAGGRDEATPGL